MTMQAHHRLRLASFGFADAEIDALDLLWKNDAIVDLLDSDVAYLRQQGFEPATALDAVLHDLDGSLAAPLLQAGFTPHQAAVVVHDSRARANFNVTLLLTDNPHPMLQVGAPPQFIIDTLRVSATPTAARATLVRWRGASHGKPSEPGDTPGSIEAAIATLAAFEPPDLADCPCG